jgi:protein-S-isoprenylcysteine O-methyltransferase Ste14
LALVGTGLLGITWALKSRVEERFLRDRYATYAAYSERVRYRLVPFLY